MARIVPISAVRSITETTSVFIMTISTTTASNTSTAIISVRVILIAAAYCTTALSHGSACAIRPSSANHLFKSAITRDVFEESFSLTVTKCHASVSAILSWLRSSVLPKIFSKSSAVAFFSVMLSASSVTPTASSENKSSSLFSARLRSIDWGISVTVRAPIVTPASIRALLISVYSTVWIAVSGCAKVKKPLTFILRSFAFSPKLITTTSSPTCNSRS